MKTSLSFIGKIMMTFVVIAVCFPAASYSQGGTTNTVTVVHVLPETTLSALQSAAASVGLKAATGQPLAIPVTLLASFVKAGLVSASQLKFAKWLACKQICAYFTHWAAGKRIGDTGTLTLEIILSDGSGSTPPPDAPRIVVELFVKYDGDKSGKPYGYFAPMGPKGATSKLDVFGDGSLILEHTPCPCK